MGRETIKKPLLIIIRGLPGAGKSALTDQLLKLPLFEGSLRLDPDRVTQESEDFQRFISNHDPEIPLKRRIYRYLLRQAEAALREGKTVIWEQPWRTVWGIAITLENLTYFLTGEVDLEVAPFRTIIIEVPVDIELARKRISNRFARGEHPLDQEAFEDFVGQLESCEPLGLPLLAVAVGVELTPEEAAQVVESFIKQSLREERN